MAKSLKCPKYITNLVAKSHKSLLIDITRAIAGADNEFGYLSLNEYAAAFLCITVFKKFEEDPTIENFQVVLFVYENLEQMVKIILNLPQKVSDWIEKQKEDLGLEVTGETLM